MTIQLANIQSLQKAIYEFPETGIVQIVGHNSNGKSILEKVLKSVATCGFVNQAERDSLIRDGENQGNVIIIYKKRILTVMLHRDRNYCIVALTRENGERVERTIRDGGLAELVHEFGFRTYGKKAVTLQLHETFGVVPFVNTSDGLNFEIVDAVTTDTVAQQFLENFREVTHKRSAELVKQYNSKIQDIKIMLQNLVLYDYEEYEAMAEQLEKCYEVLRYLLPIHLEKIIAPPEVAYADVPEIHLDKIMHITFAPYLERLENLTPVLKRIQDFEEGVCPACGRGFREGGPLCQCV